MRKWRRLSIAGLLVCLLGLYPLLAPPAHRIDQDHFDLIHNGMTLAEVESIFGQSAGSYDWAVAEGGGALFIAGANLTLDISGQNLLPLTTTRIDVDGDGFLDLVNSRNFGTVRTVVWTDFIGLNQTSQNKSWTSRHGTCTVSFDQDGRVVHRSTWGETRVVPPWQTWWKKLFGE